jgi:hypothetical protein
MRSLGVSGFGRAVRAQFVSDGLEVRGHGFNGCEGESRGSFGAVKDNRAPDLEPVFDVFGRDSVNESGYVIVVVSNEEIVVSGEDFVAFGVEISEFSCEASAGCNGSSFCIMAVDE